MPDITCPGCGGVLPLTESQLGRRIECGRCGRTFVPDDPDPPPRPSRRSRRDDWDDEDDEFEDRSDPDYVPPPRRATPAGNMAITALILGVIGLTVSLLLFWCVCLSWVGAPFGLMAIVFGMLGRRSENRGMAVAGIATGAATVLVVVVTAAVWGMLMLMN